MTNTIFNAMSVDVEDYFQVSAFANHVHRDDWERLPCRVERNTSRILALFDEYDVRATFFVLGWIAERYPRLVKDISAAGHEVASHGYEHVLVHHQNQREFNEDVARTKGILEDLSGSAVKGYRAASYSINGSNLWALDTLRETGYQYSSSIYPIHHDLYGMPEAPRFPFRHGEQGILEVPISTFSLFRRNFPCGGGGYFRLLPYRLSRWAIRRVNRIDRQAAVFYFHPWEVDPEQPRQSGLGLKTRFRHYLNLRQMEKRLARLAADFRWDRMDNVFLPPAELV